MLVERIFYATLTAKVISWRSVKHMRFLALSHLCVHNFSFQSHRLLFSHASAGGRRENTSKRKFASMGSRTHNHQAMSPTRSPLSHPSGKITRKRRELRDWGIENTFGIVYLSVEYCVI